MIDISSGHAALDAFLAGRYQSIRGMSSRFAAAICGHLLGRQSGLGVTGDLVEIGTFEGRFFIAMALLLKPGEHALGIDLFNWPNEGVYDRLMRNCADAGLPASRFAAWKVDTQTIAATDLRARLPGEAARFVHIDGDHDPQCLHHDLELAHAVLHPDGIIALDDMLHPGYPTLIETVLDYLRRHPEMRTFCIIDRESITAAAKFLICRVDRAALYEQDLMERYARFHYIVGADVLGHFTLVLTPDPSPPKLD
jgi:predicted O-methyltransferase YrrM